MENSTMTVNSSVSKGPLENKKKKSFQKETNHLVGKDQLVAPLLNSWCKTFLAIYIFRVCNSLLIKTVFNPDEYWQSLEIASYHIFGMGHLTWEWVYGIRSFTFPAIFAIVFKFLKVFGLENSSLFILAPKLIQSIFAATNDLFVYLIAVKLFNSKVAKIALLFSLTSWFNYFASVRILSNVLESTVTIIAFYYWIPLIYNLKKNDSLPVYDLVKVVCLISLGPFIRTSNIIIAVYFLSILFFNIRDFNRFYNVFGITLLIGLVALLIEGLLNYSFYGKFIIPHLNFIYINVIENVSSFYGHEPWHWYISSGLPTVLGPLVLLIPFSFCNRQKHKTSKSILYFSAYVVLALSFISHKEFRFLFPILPLLFIYFGSIFVDLSVSHPKLSKSFLIFSFLINGGFSFYFGTIHQRGPLEVADYLRDNYGDIEGVLFLTPCHSTPYYGYINLDVPMKFLTCEPPLLDNLLIPSLQKKAKSMDKRNFLGSFNQITEEEYTIARKNYITESDLYHSDPAKYFAKFAYPVIGNKTINDPTWENTGRSPLFGRKEMRQIDGTNVFVSKLEWYSHIIVFESWLKEDGESLVRSAENKNILEGNVDSITSKTGPLEKEFWKHERLFTIISKVLPLPIFTGLYNILVSVDYIIASISLSIEEAAKDPRRYMKSEKSRKKYGNSELWNLLKDSNYKECARFFNSNIKYDELRYGDVVVYCNV